MTIFVGTDLFPEFEQGTLDDCIEYCSKQKVLGLDVETGRKFPKGTYHSAVYKPGLDPYLTRIVMLQIGTLERRYVIDARTQDIRRLKPLLERQDIVFVGHNLKFERKMLAATSKINLTSMYDTMLVEKCLYNGVMQGYSLLELSKRYFGVKDQGDVDLFSLQDYEAWERRNRMGFEAYTDEKWNQAYIDKSTRMGFINIGDRPFTKAQIEYGVDDIELPLLIKKEQEKGRKIKGESYFPERLIRLEHKFLIHLSDIELNGMHFDAQRWMRIYNEKSRPAMQEHKEWLDKFVEEGYPQFCKSGDLFSGGNACAIKWTSQKQVVSFFRFLDICPKEKSKSTGRMEWSVSSVAMKKVNPPDELKDLVKHYIKFKEAEQVCTTFGKDFLKYVHPVTKRVHSSYSQLMHTGRISSRNPNLQNIKGGEHREAFTAPTGHKIANADYDGQETCYLANISGDPVMLDKLNDGEDMHCFVATNVYSTKLKQPSLLITKESAGKGELEDKDPSYNPLHKKMRQDAKQIGFGIPYGKSAFSLKWDLDVEVEEAEEFIGLYYETFPSLDSYFNHCRAEAWEHGWIRIDPVTDRRYFFPFFKEMNKARDKALEFYQDGWKELPEEQREEIKEKAKPYWSDHFKWKGMLGRRSQNYPIQGGCGSITKLAVILLGEAIQESGIDLKITNVIHDEINCEVAFGFEEAAAQMIEECMEKAGSYWCKKAPLKAKCAIVDYWKH